MLKIPFIVIFSEARQRSTMGKKNLYTIKPGTAEKPLID